MNARSYMPEVCIEVGMMVCNLQVLVLFPSLRFPIETTNNKRTRVPHPDRSVQLVILMRPRLGTQLQISRTTETGQRRECAVPTPH